MTSIAYSADKEDPANLNTVQWPMVSSTAGVQSNAGVFASDKGEGLYRAWFMDLEREYTWFAIYNLDQNLLVGYIFSKEENPWIGDWQENQRSQVMPRSGKTVAWGLEVGTTPFGSGISSIEQDPVLDTETYRLIGAKESKKQSYLIFLLEINKDFKGVGELTLEEGAIILVEKENLNQIRIGHDFAFPK